jgi:hypothetical protein
MYAIPLLHKTFGKRCLDIHAARLNTCYLAVQSLVEGAKASVTSLGRGLSGTAYDEHKIKHIDRLLSNRALHQELNPFVLNGENGLLENFRNRPYFSTDIPFQKRNFIPPLTTNPSCGAKMSLNTGSAIDPV